MVDIAVVQPSKGEPRSSAEVVLQQDMWNDFGFRTQYHLYYFGDAFSGLIGNVKILKRGQGEGSSEVLPVGPLETLSDDYCSLGQSLDYYERLAGLSAVRDEILSALRDVLKFPDHAQAFKDEPGWSTSVVRDIDVDAYGPLALVLLERDYNALPSVSLDLSFKVRGWNRSFNLRFASDRGDGPTRTRRMSNALPQRVSVITGSNGSGKSTLLARLARVLHASQAERQDRIIKRLGRITPEGIGFTRIIAVSYSAFDTFHVPGITRADKRQIMSDLRAGIGRYVFCGLRDIAREIEQLLENEGGEEEDVFEPFDVDLGDFNRDRQLRTVLKSADTLANEFEKMIAHIRTQGRMNLLSEALSHLLADPSFADNAGERASDFLTADARAMFLSRSTGHKIVLHLVAGVAAHVQPKSIVLIDEPESHLHPPLLAATMHAIREILVEEDAFGVIATHSPVVAQETLGEHLSIVRRAGDVFTIRKPKIETYGESIGEITDAIFGLKTDATDYHDVLDRLVGLARSFEEIDALFERGLSLQARAYVMSRLAERDAGADGEEK